MSKLFERASLKRFFRQATSVGSRRLLYRAPRGASRFRGLSIHNFCSVGSGVHIYSQCAVRWAASGGQEGSQVNPVPSGNRVDIAPDTVMAKGATVCDGAIRGANSFVDAVFPAGARAWGNPAKGVEFPNAA